MTLRAYADEVFARDALRREESMVSPHWRPTTLYERRKIAPAAKKLLDAAVWSGRPPRSQRKGAG